MNKALKQKSDIEHYRNKLRLKAKRKGYYDFPQVDNNKGLTERKRMYEKNQKELDHILDPDADVSSPFAEPKNRWDFLYVVLHPGEKLMSRSCRESKGPFLMSQLFAVWSAGPSYFMNKIHITHDYLWKYVIR